MIETKVIKETPLIVLRGEAGYSDSAYSVEVYSSMLKGMKVGDTISASNGACARDSIEQSLTVVYKDDEGVACKIKTVYYNDSPNAQEEVDYKLVYFVLH